MNLQEIRFSKSHNSDFYRTLQKKVRLYFKDNQITQTANSEMIFKTIFMLLLYIVPYILMLTVVSSLWAFLLAWIVMGFGMAGIGLSVMHDANHGTYSTNAKVNEIISRVMLIIGGSSVNWRIQHNVLHHTYTNVSGVDEDIEAGILLRFSPHEERRGFHRFQHIYAWFLYGFMTVLWGTSKDFQQAVRYRDMDLLKTQRITFKKHLTSIIISKIFYFGMLIALPIWLTPFSWGWIIVGFFMMQFLSGFFLSIIFQPAHVIPTSTFPKPTESGDIEADWAVNQLYNTSNFAQNSKFFSWFVGGLNLQVEHHLFPNLCHVHYRKIASIVKETTEEYNLPYYSEKTFLGALISHGKLLKNLGDANYTFA